MQLVRASLSGRTTLGVGGEAAIAECETVNDIGTALAHARQGGFPWRVLGEGSNTLALDAGYAGIVIHPTMRGVSFDESDSGNARAETLLIAEAGAHWDSLVDAAAERGLWGIANLAGIPGSAGAAAVQNIGAYGAEFKDVVQWVECVDADAVADKNANADANATRDAVRRFTRDECAFGYRESRFKHEKNLIVVRIALALSKEGSAQIGYKDLETARAGGVRFDTPADVATTVRAIRAAKFPDLAREGTAGSFFKNPIVTEEEAASLRANYPELPTYPAEDGVKVALAFILDRVLGLKGFRQGSARLFEKQPLVLVADRGARAEDVDALATIVAQKVFDATKIRIEREVVTLR